MYFETREAEVSFLKKLWTDVPTSCPKCGNAVLEPLHRKAKRSNCEWKCPACGEVYRTIRMLKELPND